MIVLDASVLIAHLDGSDPHHPKARKVLEDNAAAPFGASRISLAETLVAPARAGHLDDAAAALDLLEVAELTLGGDAPARLARLRAETNRKLPDCCVLLAAAPAAQAADQQIVASTNAAIFTPSSVTVGMSLPSPDGCLDRRSLRLQDGCLDRRSLRLHLKRQAGSTAVKGRDDGTKLVGTRRYTTCAD